MRYFADAGDWRSPLATPPRVTIAVPVSFSRLAHARLATPLPPCERTIRRAALRLSIDDFKASRRNYFAHALFAIGLPAITADADADAEMMLTARRYRIEYRQLYAARKEAMPYGR